MGVKKWEIWLADLNPQIGTEPGKTRPVVIVQSDLLNETHPSTLVCPVTTNVETEADILRIHLKRNEGGLKKDSDILVDQLRAIDNRRLIKKLGIISDRSRIKLLKNISIILDIDV